MLRRRLTIFVFAFAGIVSASVPSWAVTNVTASVDKSNVSIGEEITLTIRIQSDASSIGQPQLPPLRGFDVYSSGSSKNFEWINGRTSSSVSYTYVMSPRSEGKYVIGPVTVNVDGKNYTTNRLVVSVTPERVRRSTPPVTPPPSPRETPKPKGKHRVFITAELDRDTAYVNEAVTYIFRFYQGERLLSNPEYTRPSFPGFWVEDLPPQRKYSKVIDGVRYQVTEIRYALFPTDAGPKPIGATRLKARVPSHQRQRRGDPFSLFDNSLFRRSNRGEDLTLTTDPLNLVVLPLPREGKPEDFSGLVGHFTLDVNTDFQTVKVGDPVTVTLTVSGEGNIKSAPMPSFDSVANLRSFAAGSSESVSTAGYKISGKKSFEQVFVPQRPGTYKIPSFTLNYFDPEAGTYRELKTGPVELTATGAAADFTIPSLHLNPDQLSDLASDVRFIKTDAHNLRRRDDSGIAGWVFWFGHLLPLLSFALFLGWRRRTIRIAADPVGQRRRLAYRKALGQLPDPRHAADAGRSLEAIADALTGYYGDRFNRPALGVRRADMRADLLREGIAESDVDEFLVLLDECDRARYAHDTAPQSLADVSARARTILSRLEGTRK